MSDRKEEHPCQNNISLRYCLSEEFRKYLDRGTFRSRGLVVTNLL